MNLGMPPCRRNAWFDIWATLFDSNADSAIFSKRHDESAAPGKSSVSS